MWGPVAVSRVFHPDISAWILLRLFETTVAYAKSNTYET